MKTYKQGEMYNDPALNPVYGQKNKLANIEWQDGQRLRRAARRRHGNSRRMCFPRRLAGDPDFSIDDKRYCHLTLRALMATINLRVTVATQVNVQALRGGCRVSRCRDPGRPPFPSWGCGGWPPRPNGWARECTKSADVHDVLRSKTFRC